MKIQIITKQNLVFIDEKDLKIDCSIFKNVFIFAEINEVERWVEREPFLGKEELDSWDEVEAFIEEAKILVKKNNPPNAYSIWSDVKQDYVEDKELKAKYLLEQDQKSKKEEKELLLANLTVTTSNGNTFDGNETARINMMSAILSAQIVGKNENEWKMADNTKKIIQLSELQEALALAIQRVGEIVTK